MLKQVAILFFILLFYFVYCVDFRSKDGCSACGRHANQRPFSKTSRFSKQELQLTFGREILHGDLCHPCVLAVYRWRRCGKGTKVSNSLHDIFPQGGMLNS